MPVVFQRLLQNNIGDLVDQYHLDCIDAEENPDAPDRPYLGQHPRRRLANFAAVATAR